MEKKCSYTKQKNFLQKATAPLNGHKNKNRNTNLSQTRRTAQDRKTEDSAVLASNLIQCELLSSSNQSPHVLKDLSIEYHRLVHNIEFKPAGRVGSGVRLIAGCNQTLPKSICNNKEQKNNLQVEQKKSVGFVELFRQWIHYEQLGIPLTTKELIIIGDGERAERHKKQKKFMSFKQYCQDNCIHDDKQVRQQMQHEPEELRLHGGHRSAPPDSDLNKLVNHSNPPQSQQYPYGEPRGQQSITNKLKHAHKIKDPTDTHLRACHYGRNRRNRDQMKSSAPPPLPWPPSPPPLSVTAPAPAAPFLSSDPSESKSCLHCKTWNSYVAGLKRRQQQQKQGLGLSLQSDESSDEGARHQLRNTPKEINLPGKLAAQALVVDEAVQQTRCPAGVEGLDILLAPSISCAIKDKAVEQKEQESSTEQQLKIDLTKRNDEEFGSTDTLHKVWCHPEDYKRTSESSAEKGTVQIKYKPIDMLHVGFVGAPILDKDVECMAIQNEAVFCQEFDKLSRKDRTEGIAHRLEQLRGFQDKFNRNNYRKLNSKVQLERRSLDMATGITQQRFQCPMCQPGCPLLRNESLLAHFLAVHLSEPGLSLSDICEQDQVLIVFQPRTFQRACNICLSIIVYGGLKGKAIRMPIYNSELPTKYIKYIGYLPLFVMVCRTRLRPSECRKHRQQSTSLSTSTGSSAVTCETASSSEKATENVLALWIVGMELSQTIHVHMTVFNRRLDISRSCTVQVRSLKKSHNCEEFLSRSQNYMRLTGHDLRLLTNNYFEPIYLELSVGKYTNP